MKGVDYNKALSKEREYFQDTIKRTQDSAEKRVSDNNERNDTVQKKQRDNFIEDKAELETNYKKNFDKLNEKTRLALSDKSGEMEKEMQAERDAFNREAILKRKDFDQRLNDITASYKKSNQAEKVSHEELTSNNKKRYSRNVNDLTEKTTKKLEGFQEEMSKEGAALKDTYKRERQQLVRSHEDHLNGLQKRSSTQRAELKDRINEDLAKSKEIHSAEKDQQSQYTTDRMKNLQTKYEDRFQNMAKDYSQRSDNLVASQQQDSVRTNKEHEKHITDMRRDYNKQFRMIELDKRRRDNGSGEFAEVMNRQQGLKDENMNENRFKHLKGQLSEAQRNFQDKVEADAEDFNLSLKKEKTEATALRDRKLSEANADKIITVSREREKAEHAVGNREHQNRIDRQAFEQQLMLEKNNANDRITKLKENFNKSMTQLEEKHKSSMEDVTKVSNQDKSEFVKKMQENRNHEIFAMKREFDKMMDHTVQEYEARLGNYQRDNEYLKMTMDQKIANITDQTAKQLESQRTLFEDRRSADLKNHQVLLDQKEHTLKTTMNQMNVGYQKRIDKLQVESDTKLKLLTNDYENKLKELKAMTSKELAMKDTNHQIEMDRVKMAYEDEKNRVVSAYENQISSIKAGHRDQMDQMKDYKRLS